MSMESWLPAIRSTPSSSSLPHFDRVRWRAPAITYKDAGVDIDAGSELVRRIAAKTPGIGGFGGLYSVGGDSLEVVGTDGVGTKLQLAFEMNVHDTVGIDLVAMNVNDIVTTGARPMYFLYQLSTGHLDMNIAEQAIRGVLRGCSQSGCELSGGKVVENTGFYPDGILYEMSGCAVGTLNKNEVIDGSKIAPGDVLVGFPSTGLHSNGFSLARRILSISKLSWQDQLPRTDMTIGEALIAPTKIYVQQILDIISRYEVKGIAHITGGGLTDNVPRVFRPGLAAIIKTGSWEVPQVFNWMKQSVEVNEDEMFRTFNMGIGMVVIVEPGVAEKLVSDHGPAYRIGVVSQGCGITYEPAEARVFISGFSRGELKLPVEEELGVDPRVELERTLAGETPRLYPIGDEYSVSRAERVDDKLKLALKMNKHNTIGIDLVAVNVNGIITTGAKPLSFVDYFSTSHLNVDIAEQVIEGISEGCSLADCCLRGGETAEMKGFHWEGEYALNAYASGRVKQKDLIDGSKINARDILIGFPSSGLHTHGFSLVNSLLEKHNISLEDHLPGSDMKIGDTLLAPTKIYVKEVLEIISRGGVAGVVDIGAGGITQSISRILPPGLGAQVDLSSWRVPPVFQWLQEIGNIDEEEMLSTFNSGIGMVLVVKSNVAMRILSQHTSAFLIGVVAHGDGVTYQRLTE